MISTKKTAGIEDKPMNPNRQTAIKESKMKITSSKIIRWSGLAAMGSGLIYVAIQPIHPTDILSSVTTTQWAIVHYLSLTMDFLGLLGIAGLYARQVNKVGWLGLAGYLLFSLFYALALAFHFVEAFISPVLATEAPKFVAGLLGMVTGTSSEVSLGAIPIVYGLLGVAYLLGGVLFGIATFRAGILPRWAGGLLAIGAALTLAGALIPHPFDRIFAVPVGLAMAWLGYALWSERREQASEPAPSRASTSSAIPEPSKVA
jgi:hypothetical protein